MNDLFRDLLRKKRGFKYNLATIITLERWNNATNSYDIDTIYLKTKAITIINQRFNLNRAYEELKHRLDIWTGLGSGWIINKIEDIHIDMSNYYPLAGSSYILLPLELKHPVKGLINFPMKARDYKIIEERFNINVNVFGYENRVFPLYLSEKSNEQVLNVLSISNEEKSH